jgi:hypothetical protein
LEHIDLKVPEVKQSSTYFFERMDFCSLRGFLQANPFKVDTDTDVDALCESFVAYYKAACFESKTTVIRTIKRRAQGVDR